MHSPAGRAITLVDSVEPRDQVRLAARFYTRSSRFGYLHSLPDLVLFFAFLIGIGTLPFALKFASALGAVLIAYRMTFIIHDCAHRTLFKTRLENEIVGWIAAACLFTSFREFRRLHWIHHKHFREDGDPQGTDYNRLNPARDRVIWHILKPLFFLNAIEKLSLFLSLSHSGMTKSERAGLETRPATADTRLSNTLAIVVAQAVCVAASTRFLTLPWGYLLFLVPLVSVGLCLSRVRSYLEHGALDATTRDEDRVARTHVSNFVERNILCGLHFNLHNEHHRWPQVPSRHLLAVHREITSGKLSDRDYSKSYMASLVRLVSTSMARRVHKMSAGPFPGAPSVATEMVPCGMCGSIRSEFYAQSYDYEYASCSNSWKFERCLDCDNVYLNPRPTRAESKTIYPPSYYSYNYDTKINPIARRAKEWLDARRFAAITKECPKIECYLDIGCGNGRYLRALAATGVAKQNIFGIELDDAVVAALRADGFQAYNGPLEEADRLRAGSFQLITLFSVLEHVASPLDTLRRAHELLAPGGLLVFEAPNLESLNARLMRDHFWGGYHAPRHWNLFSMDTVRRVAERVGFSVRRLERTTGHAFWLWSMHHLVRFGWGWDRVGAMLNPGRCLPGLLVVTPIDMLRARLGQETDNMLVFLQKR